MRSGQGIPTNGLPTLRVIHDTPQAYVLRAAGKGEREIIPPSALAYSPEWRRSK